MNKPNIMENRHKPIVIVAIVTAISLLGDSMLYIVLPIYWKEVGLNSLWEVGILLSVNRFVRLPLNPFIGWLYKRMSLRTGLLTAIGLGVVTTFGYGFGKGFAIWLILRLIWGLAWSLLRMGGYFTVIHYSDDTNRGRLMGKYNGIYRLGSLVGLLVGGIMTPLLGIQVIAVLFGIMSLAGLPLILLSVKNEKVTGSSSGFNRAHLKRDLWTKPVMRVIVSGMLTSLLFMIIGSTLSLVIDSIYSNTLGSNTLEISGFVLGSTALSGIILAARWAWEPFLASWFGHLSDGPRGRVPAFLVTLVCSAIGFALIPWPFPLYLWIVIILLVLVAGTAMTTLMDAMAIDAGRLSSVITVMTAYSVATDLGAALGPLLSFWFVEVTGSLTSVYLGAAVIFVLIALWHYPLRTGEQVKIRADGNTKTMDGG
jgi:MFS family permease